MWGTDCCLSTQPYVASRYVYFELQLLRPQEYLTFEICNGWLHAALANSLRSDNATQHVSLQISNVGILNGLVVKFKIHILIGNMAVYEFKGVLHKP